MGPFIGYMSAVPAMRSLTSVRALNICNATTCTVAGPTLAGGTYAWYIQTWNPAGYGPWRTNPAHQLQHHRDPPIAAVLTEPKGNILENYTPTYKWGKVATATYYRLYVSPVAWLVNGIRLLTSVMPRLVPWQARRWQWSLLLVRSDLQPGRLRSLEQQHPAHQLQHPMRPPLGPC